MKKKATRAKRPTPQQLEKTIREARWKRISYLIPHGDRIEFNPPPENPGNRMMGHDHPIEKVDTTGKLDPKGSLGSVTRFFIAPDETEQLRQLFERFHLPERLHAELTWCYLNMLFASTKALEEERFLANLDQSMENLSGLFAVLDRITDGTHRISSASLTIEPIDAGATTSKERETIHCKGKLDTGFLDDVLKLHRTVEYFASVRLFTPTDQPKAPKSTKSNLGHKNTLKQKQSYYANSLFEYLLDNVFSDLQTHANDLPKMTEELARLKKRYPDRRLFHFIGLLMLASGLLPTTDDPDDATLIDLLKKKLAGRLARRAENAKRWKGKNVRPGK